MRVFPAGDLDEPMTILSYLGTFWSRTYDGGGQLLAYADGLGRACEQIEADLRDAALCLNVQTVPILRLVEWRPETLAASALALPTIPVVYGDNVYDDGTLYGGQVSVSGARAPLAGFVEIPLILNAVDGATVTLVDGLDYVYDGVTLTFAANPATDPRWTLTPVYDTNGVIVDSELTAWFYRLGIDHHYASNHFGYVLGLERPSSTSYRDLLVALWDALVLGSSVAVLEQVIAAIVGVPMVRKDGEVVEVVTTDGRGLFVATDQFVYRYPMTASPIVAVGDVVLAGDPLVDAVTVIELSSGSMSLPPDLIASLALPPGVLEPGFLGALVAEDQNLPVAVGVDYAGRTTLQFPLGGFPADVAEFWRRVEYAGTQPGASTLARLLDVRGPAAATEPTAASLPTTINPLRFLLDNVLRGSALLVKINAGSLPGGGAGLADLALLRRVLPPGTLCLTLIVMAPLADPVQEAVADTITIGVAPPLLLEAVVATGDDPGTPRISSRVCQ